MAAVLYNAILVVEPRWMWAVGALLIHVLGIWLIGIGIGRIALKPTYFAVTPSSISFRLHVFGPERIISWPDVAGIQVSDRAILFDLYSGHQMSLNLSSVPSSNTATHMATSLQVAALQQNVTLNGVKFNSSRATTLRS